MKKFLAVGFLFCASIVFAAIWFSPLNILGDVQAYSNNEPIGAVSSVCYRSGGLYRVDFEGDSDDMFIALDRIDAKEVKRVDIDGTIVVYAFSPRVCCDVQTTAEGEKYNVMAACSDGNISIGTPILSGSY